MTIHFIFPLIYFLHFKNVYMWELQMEYEETPRWLHSPYSSLQMILLKNNHSLCSLALSSVPGFSGNFWLWSIE
jgi:hypothetical protein